MTARVLLVGEHVVARAGVRLVLERRGFEVCGEAAHLEDAVELVTLERPDVCLVDCELPGYGIAITRAIMLEAPATAVVVLAPSLDEWDFLDTMRAGAVGYLDRSIEPEGIARVMQAVVQGEAAVPRALTPRLIGELSGQLRRRTLLGREGATLSRRELEVLELLHAGRTTAQVARDLTLSPVTVRRHMSTAIRKLGTNDRESAFRLLNRASAPTT